MRMNSGARGGQGLPELPVACADSRPFPASGHRTQRVVVANLDALHAAFAGVGIDGDREQSAAALLFLFANGPIRLRDGELEIAQRFAEPAELLLQFRPLGGAGRDSRSISAMASSSSCANDRPCLAGRVDAARSFCSIVRIGARQMLHALRAAGCTCFIAVSKIEIERMHQPRNRAVGTDRVTGAARRAVLGNPLADARSGRRSCRGTRPSRPESSSAR